MIKGSKTSDKGAWSIAPLWISPSVKKEIESYLALTRQSRNAYLTDLIRKDLPRVRKELKTIVRV